MVYGGFFMSLRRDTYAMINLKYLKENIETIYKRFKRPLMAVIKADAYGHGYKEVASYIKDLDYIEMFAVATLQEAIELRELGITKGILILGAVPTTKEEIELAISYDISLTMISLEYMYHLQTLISNKPLKIHIKLDTGMQRIGLTNKKELEEMLQTIDRRKFILEGIFTHYATADGEEAAFVKQQQLFYELVGQHEFKYIHCCNSAAMAYHQDNKSNLGRIGIVMYGITPSSIPLKSTFSLISQIIEIKDLKKGETVGYNSIYTAEEDEKIGIVAIGYADGIIRKNTGRDVFIHGKRYPIIGNICMDMLMVKIDDTVKLYDEVEIIKDKEHLIEISKYLETIPYEVMCNITKRVPRKYEKAS